MTAFVVNKMMPSEFGFDRCIVRACRRWYECNGCAMIDTIGVDVRGSVTGDGEELKE